LDWFRYFLVLDPTWDWKTLSRGEFELLFEQSIQVHASVYGGDDPNLSGFRDRGGKLLIVHGWADQFVPAQKSVAYFKAVEQHIGGAPPITNFFRLFLVPGGDHGLSAAKPAPSGVSRATLVGAILRWVEHSEAPEHVAVELYDDHGRVARTRTLSPYPQ
jgi:hypothetical protein